MGSPRGDGDIVGPAKPERREGKRVPEAERYGSRKPTPRRMLAVTQFFEDDDMAFILDRMLSGTIPCAPGWRPDAISSATSSSKITPSAAALQRPQSMDRRHPPKTPPASAPISPVLPGTGPERNPFVQDARVPSQRSCVAPADPQPDSGPPPTFVAVPVPLGFLTGTAGGLAWSRQPSCARV